MSGQTAFDKLVRLAALYGSGEADINQFEVVEGTELNEVEEGEDGVFDDEEDRVDGEEELAPPDWRVREQDPETNRPRRQEKSMNQHTYRSDTLHNGQRTHPSPRHKKKN